MQIIPFVHEGLGNSSYLVGLGDGRALLIDPDRTAQRYLQAAEERGWRIAAAFETHLHADFVSGLREVAAATGATMFVPSGAQSRFPHQPVAAGETLRLDGVEVAAVASPGHTPEHLAYVLRNGGGPPRLFSGGSLIVGGAARTDLIAPELTEELTRAQYRTITRAFAGLPDETLLLPTHGNGSFCSAGSGNDRTSTLGAERAHNPLLSFTDEDAFAKWFPTTFPGTPAYYARMRPLNQAGPRLRSEIAPPAPLPPAEFHEAMRRPHAIVVDARPVEAYAAGHIAGSLSIPFREAFAVWLGWLVPGDAALLIVHDSTPLPRIIDECLLVGYEEFAGALEGGIEAWERAGLPLASAVLAGPEAARRTLLDGAAVLDVREPDEYAAGHLPEARNIPLGELGRRMTEIPGDRPVVVYCGAGHRSTTAVSLLERGGFRAVVDLDGGFNAWRSAGYETEA